MSLNLADEISLSYSERIFNIPHNLKTWDCEFDYPSQENHAKEFYSPQKSSASAGLEPAN
jgi:hypothetical protein